MRDPGDDDPDKVQQIQTFCDLAKLMVRQEVATLAQDVKQAYVLCAPGDAGDRARAAFLEEAKPADLTARRNRSL